MGQNRNNFIKPRLFQGAIKTLVIINVAVFFFMVLFRLERVINPLFGLVPVFVWTKAFIWQPFTYMFIHDTHGIGHIFWNMFLLWMFGLEIENMWGKKEFLKYYFICGVGSGIITLLFSLNSQIPVVGASGAIYGVLLAFALLFPDRKIYIYFLIPIPAKYLVVIMGTITFFSTINSVGSNVSHLTHLGGLVIGFLYLKRFKISYSLKQKFPTINIKNPLKNIIRRVPKKSYTKTSDSYMNTDETLREQVNEILDKINQNGYDNLTPQEQQTLYLASQYFAEKHKQKN